MGKRTVHAGKGDRDTAVPGASSGALRERSDSRSHKAPIPHKPPKDFPTSTNGSSIPPASCSRAQAAKPTVC